MKADSNSLTDQTTERWPEIADPLRIEKVDADTYLSGDGLDGR